VSHSDIGLFCVTFLRECSGVLDVAGGKGKLCVCVCVCVFVCEYLGACVCVCAWELLGFLVERCGVATVSWIDKIIGLFCKRAL